MSNGFVHSVKVPKVYKVTASIVRRVREQGAGLKNLIYEKKHPNVSSIYALSANILQAGPQLDLLLQRTNILTEQPRLDPWLARVLITELLWGKQYLPGSSKPIQTILAYADKLQKESKSLENIEKFLAIPKTAQTPRYVRINTLLLSVETGISLFQEEGWKLLPRSATYFSYLQSLSQLSEPYFLQDFHIPEVLAFPPSISFYEHASYKKGELVLQNKASCLPAHLLEPAKGSVILDICAAPGMKTTHLAAKLQNNGIVYAVEIDNKRFKTLWNQIEVTHSYCVKPLNQDALTIDKNQCPRVEYILVDPTCSGSGIMDRPKQSDTDGKSEPERLQNLQSFQVYLLRHALFNFPTVKKIVYSTCSLHPEENEQVIDEVLADVGDAYRLVPIKNLLKGNWINFSSQKYKCGERCLYSRPDVDFCNGFFIAVFERNFEVPLPACRRKGGNVKFPENVNFSMELKNIVENSSRRRKKRGKKKNKDKTMMNDEKVKKVSEKIVVSEIPEIEKGKTDKTCSQSNFHNDKIALDKSKDASELLQDVEAKKLGNKKRSKYKNKFQINENEKTVRICAENNEMQGKETEIEPLRKKRKNKDGKMVQIEDNV